jgi:hypothetical protein
MRKVGSICVGRRSAKCHTDDVADVHMDWTVSQKIGKPALPHQVFGIGFMTGAPLAAKALGGMREGKMADVMQQSRQAKGASMPLHRRWAVVPPPSPLVGYLTVTPILSPDKVKHASCQVHNSEGVLEAHVRRARIEQVGSAQLLYVSEALHRPRVDDFPLEVVEEDEPMDRVADFVDTRSQTVTSGRPAAC